MELLDNNCWNFVKNDEKSGLRENARPRFCGFIRRKQPVTQDIVSPAVSFLRKLDEHLFENYGF